MTFARKHSASSEDFLEYMATLKKNEVVDIDSDSSDEIKIVCESEMTDHRCDLCCEGEFLVDKLLRFGGLIDEKYKFVCDKCDKNFVYKSELSKHAAQCTGPVYENIKDVSVAAKQTSEIKCSTCSKTFKTQGGRTKHIKSQHSDLTHTCEICKKVFTSFQKFNQHHLKHSMERPLYICKFCDKRFHTKGSLNNHHVKIHKLGKVFQKSQVQ